MEDMWLKLENATDTVDFIINLPNDGCVSVLSEISGKKQPDILWGPKYMKKGTYRLPMPTSRIIGKKGKVELFNLSLIPETETGSKGNGERQFNSPMGIDYDTTRNEILVADTGNDRIVRLNYDGRYLGKHGGFGVSFGDKKEEREDSLDNPYDVACGGFSNFYVSDQNNERICVFDSYRSYKGKFYPPNNQKRYALNKPRGIVTDYENNLWIVDGRSDRVIKVAPNGDKILEIGGFGRGKQQLKSPNKIDVSVSGEVYIADTGKKRIAVFDRLGSFLNEITGYFRQPSSVCIDNDGLLVVTDTGNNEVILITPEGFKLASLTSASDGRKLKRPEDLVCSNDYIYVLDTGNHRILHIKRLKEVKYVGWQVKNTMLE